LLRAVIPVYYHRIIIAEEDDPWFYISL